MSEQNKTSTRTILSKAIIILATLLCLNPFSVILGVPLYLIGTLAVLFSPMDTNAKLLWIVIPAFSAIAFYFLAIYIIMALHK